LRDERKGSSEPETISPLLSRGETGQHESHGMRCDVAIYAPFSRGFYDRTRGRAGGAERQMTLLAYSLATHGHRVAHIVHEIKDPVALPSPNLELLYREPYTTNQQLAGRVLETKRIWRALQKADPKVLIVRTGTPVVGIAALFCRLRRRRLIFSSANNSDFTLETLGDRWYRRPIYSLGVRLADVVVVQSKDQFELARRAFPSLKEVVHIPSFAETVPPSARSDGPPDAFLWIGRLVDYKQPLRYVELARALPDARFLMIPVADEPNSPMINQLQEAAGKTPNLEILEPMPHERTMKLVEDAVAIVNTSRLEGMPNVFLEAWARGVPVLTLQFDPDDVVSERGLGISAGGSWERFVEGARELLRERSNREELSRQTRAYIEEVHSTGVGARWSELIDRLSQSRASLSVVSVLTISGQLPVLPL
jgi:glycosyltransferase involved in cell wall biosynthesis